MKISIIVPVYNSSKYLNRCLDSLINQTYKNLEIIIVDDGSTDDSLDIIKKYSIKYGKLIKFFTQKNSGQGKARNVGLKNATGDLIAFVDSDDSIELDMYEKMVSALVNHNACIAVCDFKYIISNGNVRIDKGFLQKSDNDLKNYIISSPGPCNKLIKKDIIKKSKFKFLENHIFEDYASIPSLAIYCSNIVYLEEPLYNYYANDNSTMHTINFEKNLDILNASDNLYDIFKNRGKLGEYFDELEYVIVKNVLHSMFFKFLTNKADKKYLDYLVDYCKLKFPDLLKNKYLKTENIKYKIVMTLIFYKKYSILQKM